MLAVFDLDETLIRGDSSQLFSRFLRASAIDTSPGAQEKDKAFMARYHAGDLDLQAYMKFSLTPLKGWRQEPLRELVDRFVTTVIASRVLPGGQECIAWHKARGHQVLVISATGEHLVTPIARHLGISEGIGVQLEWQNGRLSGSIGSRRPFREGKIRALEEWLAARPVKPEKTWFYSDSHNDLPLLNHVDCPVAVNPDPVLRKIAIEKGWRILNDTPAEA